jgi:hypothetical protein
LIAATLFVVGSVAREVASARKAARRGQVGSPQS